MPGRCGSHEKDRVWIVSLRRSPKRRANATNSSVSCRCRAASLTISIVWKPTGIFNPAWLRLALAQDKLIADAIPAGLPLKLSTQATQQASAASSMATSSFTALGPKPLRMTGCSGCYNYSLTSGRVNDIAIDPVTTNVGYIATVGGGVWKTTNCCTSATSWTPTTDDPLLATISIDTITIDPNNH